jgi:hypothetical protein
LAYIPVVFFGSDALSLRQLQIICMKSIPTENSSPIRELANDNLLLERK